MPSFKGRDLLLKIGDGEIVESFTTIGAARTLSMSIDNRLTPVTSTADGGIDRYSAPAGMQGLRLTLEGLFRDQAAEEVLRAAAFDRLQRNFRLHYPNGDTYQAAFVVENYRRGGTHDGLEVFSLTLVRSGVGTFTPVG